MIRSLPLAAAFLIAGCNLVAGLGDFRDGVGGTGGTSSSTGTGGAVPETCGDGHIDLEEDCDKDAFGGATCQTAGAFYGGALGCTDFCELDTAGCFGPPSVPAPHTPMNNAYLGSMFVPGSRRPTFSWLASKLPDGAPPGPIIRYELQYDTSSSFSAPTTVDAQAQLSHEPATDLLGSMTAPVGARWFWRVRACVDTTCSAYSQTFYFNAGRVPNDFDGDGYADAVIGAYNENGGSGRAYFHRGGPMGLDVMDSGSWDGDLTDADGGYGESIATGDFNGDGYADAAISAWRVGGGVVYVHFGGPMGVFVEEPIPIAADCCELGANLGATGDVNGDGLDDLVLGEIYAHKALIFFGKPDSTFSGSADVTLPEPPQDDPPVNVPWFGIPTSSAGDLDGDGFADVIIGASHEQKGHAYVYYGGATIGPMPDVKLTDGVDGAWFGIGAQAAGDVNGDGYGDVVVGSIWTDKAYVFLGGPTGIGTMPSATLAGPGAEAFGEFVAAAGDIDGDGLADVLVGAKEAAGKAGKVYVFRKWTGNAFDPNSTLVLLGGAANEHAGYPAAAGDLNGDGIGDILVGAPESATGGKVRFYLGGPTPNDVADGVLDPNAFTDDRFGRALR